MPNLRSIVGGFLRGIGMSAATQLTPVPVPKVKPKQQAAPSYLRTATPNPGTALPLNDRNLVNRNLEDYRFGVDTRTVIRDMVASNPDLAATLNAYIRTGITGAYTAVARDMDGAFNRDATNLLQQLLTRFDVVQDYEDGFSGINSMRTNSESFAQELILYGACSGELVLGKDRLPRSIQPISVVQLDFYPDKSGKFLRPVQVLSGTSIDLDIPTFFYVPLDQTLLEPYSTSQLEAAIQPALFSQEFMNDLRRIIKRVVHPRTMVKLDEEKFRKFVPNEILHDSEKLRAYMDQVVSDIEEQINSLKPEDALVYFDMLGVELLNNGNSSLSDEYKVLQEISDAKLTTGAKALPSILGHGSGSQNIASSETLLFMKNAEGAVQQKLNEFYSRALTLAVRLFGLDVYVEFRYDAIDLRPDSELEAFKVMRQSRVLELLSLGFVTDDDASLQLTGKLTPLGFKPLAGTQFFNPPKADPNANPHNGSSGNQGGGPQNRQTQTPTQSKGPQKKADNDLRVVV